MRLFQGQIEQVIGEDLIAAGVRVHLDSILIFSPAKAEHFALLKKVLESPESVRLRIRLQKCSFPPTKMEYPRCIISGGATEINRNRIQPCSTPVLPRMGQRFEDSWEGLSCSDVSMLGLLKRLTL